MDILSIQWSTWDSGGLDIQTYLGDVFIPLRTIVAIVLVTLGVKIYKHIKSRKFSKPITEVRFKEDEYPTEKDHDKTSWED